MTEFITYPGLRLHHEDESNNRRSGDAPSSIDEARPELSAILA